MGASVHLLSSSVISISLVNNRNTIALPRYRNRDRMPKRFLQLDAQRAIYVGLIHLLYRHSWNIRPISLLGVMSNQPDILNGETPEWELMSGQNAKLHLEMAIMAHASHISGSRVSLPLPDGKKPFDS